MLGGKKEGDRIGGGREGTRNHRVRRKQRKEGKNQAVKGHRRETRGK